MSNNKNSSDDEISSENIISDNQSNSVQLPVYNALDSDAPDEKWTVKVSKVFDASKIFKNSLTLDDNYTNELANLVSQEISCIVTFYKKHFNDRVIPTIPDCVIYGKCKIIACYTFRFEFFFDEGRIDKCLVKILTKGTFSKLHGLNQVKTCRHLNKLDRVAELDSMKNSSPTIKRAKMINQMKTDKKKLSRYLLGDLGEVRSIEAYKKLAQEAARIDDYHEDDYLDLLLMQSSKSLVAKSLKHVSSPFDVLIIRDEALLLYKRLNFPTIYFDATGTVVRTSSLII